jgi:hypothetical protein
LNGAPPQLTDELVPHLNHGGQNPRPADRVAPGRVLRPLNVRQLGHESPLDDWVDPDARPHVRSHHGRVGRQICRRLSDYHQSGQNQSDCHQNGRPRNPETPLRDGLGPICPVHLIRRDDLQRSGAAKKTDRLTLLQC